ncbi:MAG: 50S ribosomal protein L15 [Patescibacteria group bacterium]|nr:50S ribosomal protein L15 [Patescibacteria group bacterium]MDD5554920.1 50S ribosomal protein L15 [Patescibacteria group bacterium]
MPLSLHTISPNRGAKKRRKRVGRGNASGHGTYSTRGQKGQKSRAGVSGLKRLGMKKQLLQTPKVRGFKSKKPKSQVISLREINDNFKDGAVITPKSLLAKRLIGTIKLPVKILGGGELKIKNVKFEGIKVSGSVEEQLKAGK